MKKVNLNEAKKFQTEELEQRLEMQIYNDSISKHRREMGKPKTY